MNTNAILNVNAQDLINTADMFEQSGSTVNQLTSEMLGLVTGLSSVWEGDVAQMYISKFTSLEDDIEKMVGMITEHVSDLYEMASNYMDAEAEGMNATEILSTDVIV